MNRKYKSLHKLDEKSNTHTLFPSNDNNNIKIISKANHINRIKKQILKV